MFTFYFVYMDVRGYMIRSIKTYL